MVSPGCPGPLLALWREVNLSQVRVLRCVPAALQLGTLGWAGQGGRCMPWAGLMLGA